MSIEIRFAEEDDAATILALVQELAEYEREPDAVIATEADYRAQLRSEHPPFECLLAESGGEAIGFALFFPSFSTWLGRAGLHLEDLFVRPVRRGGGVGRTLLARLAELALERGYGRMEWSVLDWNEPAIGFYERLGAEPLDEWRGFRLSGTALTRMAGREP